MKGSLHNQTLDQPLASRLSPRFCGSMPLLRNYQPADFETLWEIDQTCFPTEIAYSRREFAHYLRSAHAACVLAVENSRTLGFILGDHPGHSGHIITLDVIPSARAQGIGSMLMNEIEKRLRTAGCDSIFLEVAVNNSVAMRFYKRHGFSVLKTLRRYYPGDLDGLLMGKPLN